MARTWLEPGFGWLCPAFLHSAFCILPSLPEGQGAIRDAANTRLNIPAYNGGLFAADPALDALQVRDEVCAHFKDLDDYDYRPAREVADSDENTEVRSVIDVDILGHIFEQSSTDLERLRLSLQAGGVPVDEGEAKSPRKPEPWSAGRR